MEEDTMEEDTQYVIGAPGVIRSIHDDGCWGLPTRPEKHWVILPFPVAETPHVMLNGGGESVGIKGIDRDRDWYYAIGDTVLMRDSHASRLVDGDIVRVDYIGQCAIQRLPDVHRRA